MKILIEYCYVDPQSESRRYHVPFPGVCARVYLPSGNAVTGYGETQEQARLDVLGQIHNYLEEVEVADSTEKE